MSQVIYKYNVAAPGQAFTIDLEHDAQVLTAQIQPGVGPVVWVLLDPTVMLKEVRTFILIGTGWQVPQGAKIKYIATMQDGGLVWHLFEVLT